jgi:hypothetical protein
MLTDDPAEPARLATSGVAVSGSGGLLYPLSGRLTAAAEVG